MENKILIMQIFLDLCDKILQSIRLDEYELIVKNN